MASAAEAAERGAALYGQKCASCHGDAGQGAKAPAVVGKGALPLDPRPGSKRGVQFRTALDVLQYVKARMPGDDPGSLSDEDARAIIAFDLKANGVDLTGKDLSDATLAAIALH
ncbi:MAG TPA: c-type cytochrome [Kofleriaceae bacterium]|nr:c-type cytochrome [Kofleriaceae bacterium]